MFKPPEERYIRVRLRDVDDLDIISCSPCGGSGKEGKEKCPICKGTGDRVIHREKFYEVSRHLKKGT